MNSYKLNEIKFLNLITEKNMKIINKEDKLKIDSIKNDFKITFAKKLAFSSIFYIGGNLLLKKKFKYIYDKKILNYLLDFSLICSLSFASDILFTNNMFNKEMTLLGSKYSYLIKNTLLLNNENKDNTEDKVKNLSEDSISQIGVYSNHNFNFLFSYLVTLRLLI